MMPDKQFDRYADLILAVTIGLVFTQVILGLEKLNPANTAWILIPGSDTSYHYLAWEYFKDTPWTWPLGRLEGYAYPMYNSVMYTDSIPLFAFLFKTLRSVLPDDFQYFGIWHASCYVLNAWFGIQISRKIGWPQWTAWLIAPLYAGAVVLVARFGHTALCAQWVILYALLLFLKRDDFKTSALYARIGGLVFITSLIHPYLLFMVLGLVVTVAMQLRQEGKIGWPSAIRFSGMIVGLALFGWYMCGAFLFKGQLSEGLGRYSANINTLVNAWDVGDLGIRFKYYGDGQGEGIGYLGIGVIILCLFLICFFGIKRFSSFLHIPMSGKKLNWFFIGCVLFFVFALSPKWALGNNLLINWGYNDFISRTFRGTGRFIWPLHYFILYWMTHALYRLHLKGTLSFVIICLVLILQVVDLQPLWKRKPYIDDHFNSIPYIDQFKHLIAHSGKVIIFPPYTSSIATYCDYIHFVNIAQHFKKPISAGYGARFPELIGRAFRDSLNDLAGYLKSHPQDILITQADSLRLHQDLLKNIGGRSFQFDRYRVFISESMIPKCQGTPLDSASWLIINKSEAIQLRDYLTNHEKDYIIGAIQQESILGMKQETKDFLRSKGAAMDSIGFGTSWTFVFHDGSLIQQKYSNLVMAKDTISIWDCDQNSNKVTMTSGAHSAAKNESSILIKGLEYSAKRRGLNLVRLDSCGRVIEKINIDGYVSDQFMTTW